MSNIQKTKFTNSNGDNLIILPNTDSANNGDVLTVNKSGQTTSIVWAEGGGTTDISIDKCIFVDTENGSDTNSGLAEDKPVKTVSQAYTLMEANDFDTLCVIGTEPNDPQENLIEVEIPAVPDTLHIDELNIVTKISSQLTFVSINKVLNINAKSSVLKVFYGGTVTSNINITSDGNVEIHNTEEEVESTTSNLKINANGDVFLNCIPYDESDYGYYPDTNAEYYDLYVQSVNVKANNIYACGGVKNDCNINLIAYNDVYNAFKLYYIDSQGIEESDSNWANVTQNYYLEAGNRVCQIEDIVANTFIVKSKYYGYYDGSKLVTGGLNVKSRVDIRTTNDTYIGNVIIGDLNQRGHIYIVGGFEQCVSDKAQFDEQGKSLNNPILQIKNIISHQGITVSRNLNEYAPIVFIDWKGLIVHSVNSEILAQQYKEKSLGYAESSNEYTLMISGVDYFDNDTPVYHNYPVEIYSEGTLRNLRIFTGIDVASQKYVPVHIKCKDLISDNVEIHSHNILIEAKNDVKNNNYYLTTTPAKMYDEYYNPTGFKDTSVESTLLIKAGNDIEFIPDTSVNDHANQVVTVEAGNNLHLLNNSLLNGITAKILNIKAHRLYGNFKNFTTELHVDVDVFESTQNNVFEIDGSGNELETYKWSNILTTQSTFKANTVVMTIQQSSVLPYGIFVLGVRCNEYPNVVRNLDIHINTIVCSFSWASGIYCPIIKSAQEYNGEISGEIGCIVNTYDGKIHKVSRWQKDLIFYNPQTSSCNPVNGMDEGEMPETYSGWGLTAKVSLHFAEHSSPFDIYFDPDQGDDRFDGLTASTPVKSMVGLYRCLKLNFSPTISGKLITIQHPVALHMLSTDINNNRGSSTKLSFYIDSSKIGCDSSLVNELYDIFFSYLEIIPEEPNLELNVEYLNSSVLYIHDFKNVNIRNLYGSDYSGLCSIQCVDTIEIRQTNSSPANTYDYYNSRPFAYVLLDSYDVKLTGMFRNLHATAKNELSLVDSYGGLPSTEDNCCLTGDCHLTSEGFINLGKNDSPIGIYYGYTHIKSGKDITIYNDTLLGNVNIEATNSIQGSLGTSYMNCKLQVSAAEMIKLNDGSFNGTSTNNTFSGSKVELCSLNVVQANGTGTFNFYKTDVQIKAKTLRYATIYLYHNASSNSKIEADYIQYTPIHYRLGTLSIKTNSMTSSQIRRLSSSPTQLDSNNYTENLYLDIKTADLNCSLPLSESATGGTSNIYGNIETLTYPFIGWSSEPSGITADVIYNFNVTIGHSRYQNPEQAISYQGDTLPVNATGKILILNRDIVKDEGLQSINKQVTIPTGSTVASVTLENDKYNIIDTINSTATELDINIPKSLTKVQEGSFEFGVGSNSVLAIVKAFVAGRQIPVNAPSVFDSTKMYQGTSLNNAIIITEFNTYPIIITNIEATNNTGSSIDIVVTGTMGSDPLPNNLEYTLSLSLDGVITNINVVGTTTTLDGTNYTNYSNASDVAAIVMLDDKNYNAFTLKGNPLILDGRLYKTVTIGNQTWMAENLDYKFNGLQLNNSLWSYDIKQADYYDKDEATYGVNGNKYGLLYNFIAAKYLNNNKSSLIPGWHVPSLTEWNTLINYVGGSSVAGSKLKSTTDWMSGPPGTEGTDEYGFNAKPAGYGSEMNNAVTFNGVGAETYFLTSTPYGNGNGNYNPCNLICMKNWIKETELNTSFGNDRPFSIRLIKD